MKLKREFLDLDRANKIIKARIDSGFEGTRSDVGRDVSLTGIRRVLRNRTDYGAVLLLDFQVGDKMNQIVLSKWVRANV